MGVPIGTRLETARLVLRAPRSVDVPELRRMLRKNSAYLRPWLPAPQPGVDPTSIAEISKTVARYRGAWRRDEAYNFLIEPAGESRIIGRISLTHVARGVWQNAHVGYFIDESEQGKGFTAEALDRLVTFSFETLLLHRVQAAIMPRNARSVRVVEKTRFRKEGMAERFLKIAGKWEDHLIFAITAEEH